MAFIKVNSSYYSDTKQIIINTDQIATIEEYSPEPGVLWVKTSGENFLIKRSDASEIFDIIGVRL